MHTYINTSNKEGEIIMESSAPTLPRDHCTFAADHAYAKAKTSGLDKKTKRRRIVFQLPCPFQTYHLKCQSQQDAEVEQLNVLAKVPVHFLQSYDHLIDKPQIRSMASDTKYNCCNSNYYIIVKCLQVLLISFKVYKHPEILRNRTAN